MLVTLNLRYLGTLPSNTVQNLKNDVHLLSISTRSAITTMDPLMPTTEVVDYETPAIESDKVTGVIGIVAKDKGKCLINPRIFLSD